jgi:hypothetical protein
VFSYVVGEIAIECGRQIIGRTVDGGVQFLDFPFACGDKVECAVELREVFVFDGYVPVPEIGRTKAELAAGDPVPSDQIALFR